MVRWRSLLFAPADDYARLAKIATRGADAVILDLEDAVAPERKAKARERLPDVVAALAGQSVPVVVRVNSAWRALGADLTAALHPGVEAVMVPKVQDSVRLEIIGEMIADYASAVGLAQVPGLIALIESPTALATLDQISAVPGVVGLALGSEDFSLALGVPPTPAVLDLPCRMIALAASPRGLMALGLPVSIGAIDDLGAWHAGVALARAYGMSGALCIHPKQIAPVNEGFTPSPVEIEAARCIVAAWEERGEAGVILVEGKMVDLPVLLSAVRTLAMAEASAGAPRAAGSTPAAEGQSCRR